MLAQQIKADGGKCIVVRKTVGRLLQRAVTQSQNVTLQRHQISIELAVQDHQVHWQPAKLPPGLSPQQRLHHVQAAAGVNAYQHNRPVAGQAKAPQLALVDQWVPSGHVAEFLAGWSLRGQKRGRGADVHQRCRQVLQGCVFFRCHAQVAQPDLRQRGGHDGGPFDMHALQIFVDATRQLVCVVTRSCRERQACLAVGRNTDAKLQPASRVKLVVSFNRHWFGLTRRRRGLHPFFVRFMGWV